MVISGINIDTNRIVSGMVKSLEKPRSWAYGKCFAGGGGGGILFAQKNLASCSNFYERVEKKREPHCNNIGRTDI